jgi:hypothetical protein
MVTTTVGVLHGVTGNTTDLGPAVALATEAVEGVTGLEDGLLNTTTTSDDADHGAALGGHRLLLAAGELQARAAGLGVVGDDDAVVTAGASEHTAVTSLGLDVAHDATLGDVAQGHHVANGHGSLGTAEHRLASEHTLGGNHELLDAAELVRVAELHACKRGTTPRLVLDALDNTAHEAVALGVVQNAELGRAEALVTMDLVHGALTLTAREDGLSHDFGEVSSPIMNTIVTSAKVKPQKVNAYETAELSGNCMQRGTKASTAQTATKQRGHMFLVRFELLNREGEGSRACRRQAQQRKNVRIGALGVKL